MSASADIDGLVARGLDRYRAGDIDGALALWETALATDPEDPRALGYVDYVRQNYDELSGGASPMSEQLIPFGLARGDDDEYEISITAGVDLGDVTGEVTGSHRRGGNPDPAPEPSIDDGWGLEAEHEPTVYFRPGAGAARRGLGVAATAFDDDSGEEATIERGQLGGAALTADFGSDFTGERTTERVAVNDLAPEVLRGLGISAIGASNRAASEDLTTEGWPRPPDLDLASPRTETLDLYGGGPPGVAPPVVEPLPPPELFEDQGTADLKVKVRIGDAAREDARRPAVPIEDLLLPPPPSKTVTVDDDTREERMPRSRALTADEAVTEQVSQEIDVGAPAMESTDDRARRRISSLLARAQRAATDGDHATAVAAIDLALSEAPDVAAAQKLVHRSRDLILDCYYRFFGDLQRLPVLSAPLSELTRRPLDPRAAFLLSRIDGTLTYEEILDVAGMGRLEACRHLAHLLWRGIITAK